MTLKRFLVLAGVILACAALLSTGAVWLLHSLPNPKPAAASPLLKGWSPEDPNDFQLRRTYVKEQLIRLFDGKFDELETEAARVREGKMDTPPGCSSMDVFYSAFDYSSWNDHPEWDRFFKSLDAWQQKFPASVPVRVARATALIDYAWEARGSGYANTVTEEGWRLFGERIEQTAETLSQARALGGEANPVYWQNLLVVAKAQSWPQAHLLQTSEEALAHFPLDPTLYSSTCTSLLPRWGGAEGQWREWFLANVPKMGTGPEADVAYARAANKIFRSFGESEGRFFSKSSVSWPRTRTGLDVLCASYPSNTYWKAVLLDLAYHADDKETARRALAAMNNRYDQSMLGRKHLGEILEWLNK